MKESSYNNRNDFIAGWYIDPKLCDAIVAKGESNTNVFLPVYKNYNCVDLKDFDQQMHDQYQDALCQCVEAYKEKYPWCYKELRIWGWTFPRIQRYEPGQYYKEPHCENDGNPSVISRHLAYMTYLNDVTDGGGTEFLNQNITVSAEKGLTLLWPAHWTHYHRGIVSNTQVKYILTGWCVFRPNLPDPLTTEIK